MGMVNTQNRKINLIPLVRSDKSLELYSAPLDLEVSIPTIMNNLLDQISSKKLLVWLMSHNQKYTLFRFFRTDKS